MKFLVKYRKVLLFISFLLIAFILWLIGYETSLNYSFNGVVENVSYDVQHHATVTIRGKEYELGLNTWGRNKNIKGIIEKGDSMIKKKGELYIELIKRNKKDSLIFLHK